MKKIAVIGLGNIATRHRHNLRLLYPEVKIYAISSSKRMLSELPSDCDGYLDDVSAAINEHVDMAVIASPSTYHLEHSRQFIEAGIPLLIEKPVTASFNDAKELIGIASNYTTPLAVGYCLRYLPSAKIVKNLISDNFAGKIYNVNIEIGQYLPDWRPTKSYRESVSANRNLGGGALLELSHELDYAQWIFGELNLISSVIRSSDELEMDVESLADITAINAKSTLVSIHLDFLQKKAWRQCHIIGSKGRIVWDLIGNEVIFYNKKESKIIYSEPGWDQNSMYLDMLNDFIKKIAGYDNHCATLKSSAEIIGLIEKIKEKSQLQGAI